MVLNASETLSQQTHISNLLSSRMAADDYGVPHAYSFISKIDYPTSRQRNEKRKLCVMVDHFHGHCFSTLQLFPFPRTYIPTNIVQHKNTRKKGPTRRSGGTFHTDGTLSVYVSPAPWVIYKAIL